MSVRACFLTVESIVRFVNSLPYGWYNSLPFCLFSLIINSHLLNSHVGFSTFDKIHCKNTSMGFLFLKFSHFFFSSFFSKLIIIPLMYLILTFCISNDIGNHTWSKVLYLFLHFLKLCNSLTYKNK